MTSHELSVDELQWNDLAPNIDVDNEIDDEFDYNHVAHIISSQVRNYYMKFVQKLLNTNFRCCQSETTSSDKIIEKCAIMLEEKAARSCMVMNLYRRSILQIIENIRKETHRHQLNQCIEVEIQKEVTLQMVDASTQTEVYDRNGSLRKTTDQRSQQANRPKTLDEKLRYFEFKMNNERKFAHRSSAILPKPMKNPKPPICITPSIPNTPENITPAATPLLLTTSFPPKVMDQDIDDDITRELHEIFGTQQSQYVDPIEEIFGESISVKPESPHPQPAVLCGTKSIAPILPTIKNRRTSIDFAEELSNSIWPCELHKQRLKLQRVLESISEKGLRHNEKVKRRFLQLFGEDDDDEFGPYSPSLAMNDILMASCKKRIAPWIVKALMVHLQNGQIGNRYLFKKIAKRIAEGILVESQLPDERAIRDAVMHFFTMYPQVNSLADIEATS